MRITAMLALILFAYSGPASAYEDRKVGQWTVKAGESACGVFREYSNGTELRMYYTVESKSLRILFSNFAAKSVADGQLEGLKVGFVNSAKTDWEVIEYVAFEAERLTNEAVLFRSEVLTDRVLRFAAKFSTIHFATSGETNVGSFSLSGSAAAIAELEKCAYEVVGKNPPNPNDPFAK